MVVNVKTHHFSWPRKKSTICHWLLFAHFFIQIHFVIYSIILFLPKSAYELNASFDVNETIATVQWHWDGYCLLISYTFLRKKFHNETNSSINFKIKSIIFHSWAYLYACHIESIRATHTAPIIKLYPLAVIWVIKKEDSEKFIRINTKKRVLIS